LIEVRPKGKRSLFAGSICFNCDFSRDAIIATPNSPFQSIEHPAATACQRPATQKTHANDHHLIAAFSSDEPRGEWQIRDEVGNLMRVWAVSSATHELSQDPLPREAMAALDGQGGAWSFFKFTLYFSIGVGLLYYFAV